MLEDILIKKKILLKPYTKVYKTAVSN